MPLPYGKGRTFPKGIEKDPKPRQVLGDHRSQGRSSHAHPEAYHEQQVQKDVHHRGKQQEVKGYGGISHSPQQTGEIIIEKHRRQAEIDDPEVLPHHGPDLRGDIHKAKDGPHQQEHQHIHQYRDPEDQKKGQEDAVFQAILLSSSVTDGYEDPVPHGKSDEDGGQKGHQGIGRSHRRQGVLPQELSHNEGICDVVKLLQQISRHHGKGKKQEGLCDISFDQ